jgi:ADP-heptose:LPS heptosyltransferase
MVKSVKKGAAKVEPTNVKTIVVIKFFGLGSIVLTMSALQVIRSHFPRARIVYLSFQTNRELLERLENIDTILTIRTGKIFHFIYDAVRVFRHIRNIRPDIVFDFEFFSKFSTLFGAFSNAPIRSGFLLPTRWRRMLLTHSIPLTKNEHVSDAFCEQVYAFGAKRQNVAIASPRVDENDVARLARHISLNGKAIVAINVNAGSTFLERRWQPERFAQLVNELANERDCLFVFIGNNDEHEYVERVIRLTNCQPRCHNLAGRLTIGELLALLRQSDLLISNDSGPLHLASAVGTATVGLFGPETPTFYGQRGQKSAAIYKAISCSPCMNIYDAKTFQCPYNAKCMHAISVEEVKEAVASLHRITEDVKRQM